MGLMIEIVRKPPDQVGFVVRARRWAAERSLPGSAETDDSGKCGSDAHVGNGVSPCRLGHDPPAPHRLIFMASAISIRVRTQAHGLRSILETCLRNECHLTISSTKRR